MKKVFRVLLTTVMMVAFSIGVSAQETNAQKPSKKQRMSREQMAEMQARHIASQLALDDATSKKFIETFSAYQKEIWALRQQGREMHKNRAEMTEAEAEKAIKDQFDHSQKVLSLRQEYYNKYSKFMSAKQIQRVYELEKQSMNRLSKRGGHKSLRNKNNSGPRPKPGHHNAFGKGKHNGRFPHHSQASPQSAASRQSLTAPRSARRSPASSHRQCRVV